MNGLTLDQGSFGVLEGLNYTDRVALVSERRGLRRSVTDSSLCALLRLTTARERWNERASVVSSR